MKNVLILILALWSTMTFGQVECSVVDDGTPPHKVKEYVM